MFKKLFIVLLILVLTLVGIIVAIGAYDFYKMYPIKEYCSDIKLGDNVDLVLSKASKIGFIVPDHNNFEEHRTVTVMNQMAPFSRFACFIEYSDNKVLRTEFLATD